MRDAVRNKERWKRRRTPTQDPSTDLRGKLRDVVVADGLDGRELGPHAAEGALVLQAPPMLVERRVVQA